MLFSTNLFLSFFFPILLFIYIISPVITRKLILLAASLLFYSWGEPFAVFSMLIIIIITFFSGVLIYNTPIERRRSRLSFLSCAVITNLLFLIIYKYLSFITSGINVLCSTIGFSIIDVPRISLPIGVSFFIFQSISYLVDVYRNQVAAQQNFISLALYISFFPQLLSGPIVRYATIWNDLENRKFCIDNAFNGFQRFSFGLAKKVLLADNMALIADRIFNSPVSQLPCGFAWLGAIAYTLQIYYDFSGYSDMAIGLARIFNFKFPENFNYPYSAISIQDFWRRWHISLSSWFRDYLYIPLGGNRISKYRNYGNLFIVFGLCGLWHGASLNFLTWGMYHGLGLVGEKMGIIRILDKLPKFLANIYVLFFVLIGWVFFRSQNLPDSLRYLRIMFTGNDSFPINTFSTALDFISYSNFIFLIIAIFLSFPYFTKKIFSHSLFNIKPSIAIILFIVAYHFSMTGDISPFIYFRF